MLVKGNQQAAGGQALAQGIAACSVCMMEEGEPVAPASSQYSQWKVSGRVWDPINFSCRGSAETAARQGGNRFKERCW